VLFAFDVLFVDGTDMRRQPLIERREKLRQIIPIDARSAIQFSDHYEGEGAELFSGPAPWAWRALCQSGRSVPTRAGRPSSG
jgi:bifunctional non-homologous end joining protein LigD